VVTFISWKVSGPLVVSAVEARVPAGFPSPADDYLERPLDLNEFLVRNKPATFLMRVEGDSMIGAGIHHGNLLVVDRSIEATSGHVVVVAVDGEYMVKRLRRTPECVWLDSENPHFRAIRVDSDADLHVFGVVVHAIHTLR
jgi:DNA polymerase V